MPLVRSSENIPTRIEQEDVVEQGAGGDTVTPLSRVSRPRTRLQTRREAVEQESVDDIRVRRIVDDSLREFRDEIGSMIENTLRNLTMANLGPISQGPTGQEEPDNRSGGFSTRNVRGENHRDQNTHFYFEQNTEKVLNLIRNWKIRFTGDVSEFTVDEFIYRVNTLTYANLRGDFRLLCEHVHILFEGNALKWYWRYHRSCENIDWKDLCDALKRQYKDYKTDFDVKDEIMRRKQRANESFDEFYDSIIILCDRLRIPLTDIEHCEMIQRNLRPEVRHELLHLEINQVAQLRRAVRRHEQFIGDMSISNLNRRLIPKGQISEIADNNITEDPNKIIDEDLELCLIVQKGKCWNCDKPGHSFVDCLETRTIFCYGCGTKNVCKPQCRNCLQKKGNGMRDVRVK